MQNNGTTYQFVQSAPLASVGPMTAESLACLLQSYEEEGVPEEDLLELRALLEGLRNGTASIPEPQSCFYEVPPELRKGLGGYEYVYATAPLADPFADFRDIELVPVEPVTEALPNHSETSHSANQAVNVSAAQRRLEGEHRVLEAEWNERNEKLQELRIAFVREAGAAVKFQLQKDIQTEESALAELSDRLEKIEEAFRAYESPNHH